MNGIVSLHLSSALVSQLVRNVPFIMLVIPLLEAVPGDLLWVSLAAGATLGGNATIIGAVANIIVAEQANREGIHLGFLEFAKVWVVVTGLTLAASVSKLCVETAPGSSHLRTRVRYGTNDDRA